MKKNKLSYREISSLCLELALFLHSGSSAGAAFAYIAASENDKKLAKIYADMGMRLDGGEPLFAVAAASGLFPDDVAAMLKIASETGKSEETLRSLSSYYDRLDTRDRQLRSAVLYPSILLAVMAAVVVLLLVFVLPIFADVYASFGASLTGFSGFLLSLGEILSDGIFVVCAVFFLAIVFLVLFSASETFRAKITGFGGKSARGISKKINTARFASALAMALSSGLSLDEAVLRAGEILSEREQENIRICADKLSGTGAVDKAFCETGLLPAPEARLLALGVSGGGLDAVADEIARRLDLAADDAMERSISRAEPIMVIVSSLLIGAILLSVMIPLANIMSAIG